MATFVGIDLSWTGRNESGICILEEEAGVVRLARLEAVVVSAEEICDQVASIPGELIVAVDAPLIRAPGCTAERELGRSFGRYKASAYTASVDFLSRKGLMAGPELGAGFTLRGLSLGTAHGDSDSRRAFETYPHALHVLYFGLAERLQYKKGRLGQKRDGLRLYQGHLRELLREEMPLVLASEPVRLRLHESSLNTGGAGLKHLEDALDGLTCAYAAWRAWRDGIGPPDVFGDPETGAITIPGLRFDPRFART